MGSLTWFLPISKNRNLETVAACSGDPSWFDSMIQALGSLQPHPPFTHNGLNNDGSIPSDGFHLHKCPLKQGLRSVHHTGFCSTHS